MPSLAQFDPNAAVKALLKGESGSGKTPAALSFAQKNRQAYIFDYDQRLGTAADLIKRLKPELLDWIHYDTYRYWKPAVDKLDSWISRNQCPYGVIIVDSVTTLAKAILLEQIEDRKERAANSKNKANSDDRVKELKLGDISVSSIEDYKAENTGISTILSMLKADCFKECDIFVIAHVMVHFQKKLNEDEGKPTRRIVTAGQAIAAEIPIYFDNIWHFNQGIGIDGKAKYEVMFKPTVEVRTEFNDFSRCAYSVLPDSMDITGKLLGDEFRKLVVKKASGF